MGSIQTQSILGLPEESTLLRGNYQGQIGRWLMQTHQKFGYSGLQSVDGTQEKSDGWFLGWPQTLDCELTEVVTRYCLD